MIDSLSTLPQVPTAAQPSRTDLERQMSSGEPEDAAKKMEALFATLLVRELRRALPEGFFGKAAGADTFEGWLDQHLGQALADSGALDLAGQIKVSLEAKAAAESESEPESAPQSANGPGGAPERVSTLRLPDASAQIRKELP